MNKAEFEKYVKDECARQWHECQEEDYGAWDSQSEEVKSEYYKDMKKHLKENIIQDEIRDGMGRYEDSDAMKADFENLKSKYQTESAYPMPSDEEIKCECRAKMRDQIAETTERMLDGETEAAEPTMEQGMNL